MEGIGFALAKIISERSARHGSGPVDFETVHEAVVERAGISPDQAEALLWGEPVALSIEETDRLAEAFSLEGDLLSPLLRPTSKEILLHVLRSFEGDLEPSCPDCAFLLSSLGELHNMPRQELLQVCVDFLDHLSPTREELAPGEEGILEVFRQLDVAAQARVLAYAYSEKARAADNPLQARTVRFSELRNNFLPPSARRVLDLIAHSGGTLSLRELARKTREEIDDLEAIVDAALTEMALAGTPLDEKILLFSQKEEAFVSLSPEALPIWQSMLKADAVFIDDNILES
jgi:hypothetical protein